MADKIIEIVEEKPADIESICNAVNLISDLIDGVSDTDMPRKSLQNKAFGQLRPLIGALKNLLEISEEYASDVKSVAEATKL
jgi:hypothetical protein